MVVFRPASSSLLASLPAGCVAHCCKPAPGLMLFKRTSQMPPLVPISHFDPNNNYNKIKKQKTNLDEVWMNKCSLPLHCPWIAYHPFSDWASGGPIQTGRGFFLCTAASFSDKVLASLSCWPDDLGCHVFIHAKWLVLWYVSIGLTRTKALRSEKRKNSSS